MPDLLEPSSDFNILSLDGGGIRGVFSAALLGAFEEDFGISVADHFDLIAGTSTGGIIALALGLGIPVRDVLNFYQEKGPGVFGDGKRHLRIRHWFRTKHQAGPLERALKEVFGDRTLGESRTRLVIPSYNLAEADVYVFRTPHLDKLRRDYRVPAWKVALATSAAPTYLPTNRDVDGLRLIDGGVWANNPSLAALAEASGQLGIDLHAVRVLNIGTVTARRSLPVQLDNGGRLRWAQHATRVIMDAGSIAVRNQTRFLLGEGRYLRIDGSALPNELSLDDPSQIPDLIQKARHLSRHFGPRVAPYFDHMPSRYEPMHTRKIP